MARDSDNLAELIAWIDGLVETFDFTLPGVEGSLGRDLAAKAAEGLAKRSNDSLDPDGTAWEENSAQYEKYKRKRYLMADRPNIRTGQMLSPKSLLGGTEVSRDEVLMKYGTGEVPTRAVTGVPLSVADESITDIEKAFFCSQTRRFYALDEKIADDLQGVAQNALDKHIAEPH